MRRETFNIVENILKDIPRVCKSFDERSEYISSIAQISFNTAPRVDGGVGKLSEPEHITDMKIHDAEYQELCYLVENITAALMELPYELLVIVKQYYFEELMDVEIADALNYSEHWINKLRRRAVRLLVEPCLKIHLVVDRWRRRERKRQIDIIIKLMKCV